MRKINTPCVDHGCKGFGLGYATAWLTIDGKRYTTTKHRAVFFKLSGYLPEGVMHTCDNPRCINPEHLVAGTHKLNAKDKLDKGRGNNVTPVGMLNPNVRLTDKEVMMIKDSYIKGSRTFGCVALAKVYNCGSSQIWRIVNGINR